MSRLGSAVGRYRLLRVASVSRPGAAVGGAARPQYGDRAATWPVSGGVSCGRGSARPLPPGHGRQKRQLNRSSPQLRPLLETAHLEWKVVISSKWIPAKVSGRCVRAAHDTGT